MKKKILLKLFFGLFSLAILFHLTGVFSSLNAQDDQTSRAAIKELIKDLRDWGQLNIIPSMKQWKIKLDGAMTDDDLSSLNSLRDEANILYKKSIYYTFAILRAKKKNLTDSVTYYTQEKKIVSEDQKKNLEELKPLATKYKPTLEEIGSDAKPLVKLWGTDLKEILKTWFETNKNNLSTKIKLEIFKKIIELKLLEGLDTEKKETFTDLNKKLIAGIFMFWDGKDLPSFEAFLNDEQYLIDSDNKTVPTGYDLSQNYPNPFNPSTTIEFALPQPEYVTLKVFDAIGKEVNTLIDNNLTAGIHKIEFNGANLSSGLYIYRLKAGSTILEKRMQLIK